MNIQKLLTRVTLLCLLFSSLGLAQKTGELPILPTPNGAILRWYLPNQTFPARGFRLERTNPDGSRTNLAVASPMPKAEVERQKLLEPKFYDYLQSLYLIAPKNSNEKFQRGILDLKALTDSKMARVLGVFFEDKGLQAAKKYSYRVLALGSSETVVGSASVTTGKTPIVPVVGSIGVGQSVGKISLTWQNPGVAADIVAYRIYKAESNSIFVPQVNPLYPSGNKPNFVDTQINPEKTYQYAISSIDVFGREGARSQAISVDARLAAPLLAPRIIDIGTPDDRLELRFTKNLDTRVSKILIYRGSNVDKLVLLTNLPASASSYTDKTVRGGISYAYAIAVQSGSSISAKSAAKVAVALNRTAPKTPVQLSILSSTKTIVLKWAANPEPDLRGYLIFRSSSKNTALKDSVLLSRAPQKNNSYTDTLPIGFEGVNSYRVVAINTSGVRSRASAGVSATLIDKTPPATPTLLNVKPLENSVGLTFSSGDPDTVQILIYRVSPQGRLQLVKKLAPNATGFIDSTAIPNLPYVYTIIALDAKGNRSKPSNRMVGTAILTQAPVAPVVKVQIKNGTATFTWTRAKPRTYFVLYRLQGTQWIQVSEVIDALILKYTRVKKGEKYAFRAMDLAGNQSKNSNILEIK